MTDIAVEHTFDVALEWSGDLNLEFDVIFQQGYVGPAVAVVKALVELVLFSNRIEDVENAISDIYKHINRLYQLVEQLRLYQIEQRDALFDIAAKFEYSDRVHDYFHAVDRFAGDIKPDASETNELAGLLLRNHYKLLDVCNVLEAEVERRLMEISPSDKWLYFILPKNGFGPNHSEHKRSISLACREYIRFVLLTLNNAVVVASQIPLATNLSASEKAKKLSDIRRDIDVLLLEATPVWDRWLSMLYIVDISGVYDVMTDDPPMNTPLYGKQNFGYTSIESKVFTVLNVLRVIPYSSKVQERKDQAKAESVAAIYEICRQRRKALLAGSVEEMVGVG